MPLVVVAVEVGGTPTMKKRSVVVYDDAVEVVAVKRWRCGALEVVAVGVVGL